MILKFGYALVFRSCALITNMWALNGLLTSFERKIVILVVSANFSCPEPKVKSHKGLRMLNNHKVLIYGILIILIILIAYLS